MATTSSAGSHRPYAYALFALLALALACSLIAPSPAGAAGFRSPTVSAISAGFDFNCALTSGGAVKCWGLNYHGELGDGTTVTRHVPETVKGLGSGVAAISAGFDHACALTTGGAVKCWGYNYYGQLGNGTTTTSTVPVSVTGLGSGVSAISAGGVHTCALTTAGAVKCWGDNVYGQLGNGTTTDSTVPVSVTGLGSGVSAVSTGGDHTCALTTAGALECWGANVEGQLGNGSTTSSAVPVSVTGLGSGVTRVSAGTFDTCAVTSAGAAKCWGSNQEGELGNGTKTDSTTPVPVSGLGSGVATISAGWPNTCAVTAAGKAMCWGANDSGELGDGTTTSSTVPVAVSGLGSGTASVAISSNASTCGLTGAGSVKCWGNNSTGQLGVPRNGNAHLTPVDVQWFAVAVTVGAPVTPGVPFTVTARATDAYGTTLTDYGGTATWSDLTGTLSPASPADFVNGVSTTTAKIGATFATDRIAVASGGADGTSDLFTPPPARLALSLPAVKAGQSFTVNVTALDANDKRMWNYNVGATWSDLSGQLAPAAPASFVNGVSTTTATIATPYHGDKITFTSGGVTQKSSYFAVVGPATAFTLTVAAPVTVATPFKVVAWAVDSAGNLVKDFNPNPAPTWSDLSGKLSPAAPAAFASGVSKTYATISVPFHNDRLTFSAGGISAHTPYFNVLGPLAKIDVTVPATVTHGVPFTVKAVARDTVGNRITTYSATATWTSLSGGLSPSVPTSFATGLSTTSATIASPFPNNRITVTSGGISGKSGYFSVS